ncbi:MAG: TIGR01459 family HAD-type hydrolase [Aestuariivirga sp.]|uniref:TIGR01459 family HAD-type hydrolase n=1 Tax=Aestuariivirga sp. TaxID=2650926 RepID=UPI0025BCE02F|nr:TIGR01459 family HAD-type hydrolase [Aestuariivirga sp.]MCA3560774.1 TIGR01459 family HAD-type hydrolase [Aestuariivirga sp.]
MREFSDAYPIWFCDIWGVVHNGVAPFPITVAALKRHRARGGAVILVTNSPRSNLGVERQLIEIGVDPASHDRIVTSGDVTQVLMKLHGDRGVYHVGAARDLSIYEGTGVARVGLDAAEAVLCTGLFDDLNDRLEDYQPLLDDMKRRGLAMICANPDKIVKKGDRILYCAGKLAEMYQARGGEVLMAGKPFAPIYDLALAEARRITGKDIGRAEILAIGDGPETDIRGAADYGLDALLVAEGVTDAGEGLHVAEARVLNAVPHARIVATVHDLSWV